MESSSRFFCGVSKCIAIIVLVGGWSGASWADDSNHTPSRAELDQANVWLWAHPSDGSNRAQRRQRMAIIQAASDQFPPESYWEYVKAWTDDPAHADGMQDDGILYYLSMATEHAIRDIRQTRVIQGVIAWHIYNMGYVFKTPKECFGIDIHSRDAAQLADDLDFLLVTHEHGDHHTRALLDEMIKADKPVITRWYPGTTVINEPREMVLGSLRVRIDVGDHHCENPDGRDNMLMYQVDCGAAGLDCTIYHSGGGNNFEKIQPDRDVDLFIVHVQIGMDIAEAIRHLKPRRTAVSHVLELGHSPKPPHAWRWSYDYAFGQVRDFSEDQAIVLTWGERWMMPGTVLAGPAEEESTLSSEPARTGRQDIAG